MKLKRYILLLITLILAISFWIKDVYAAEEKEGDPPGTCYYKSKNLEAMVTFIYRSDRGSDSGLTGYEYGSEHKVTEAVMMKYGTKTFDKKGLSIKNLDVSSSYYAGGFIGIGGVEYHSADDLINTNLINSNYPQGCPKYIVVFDSTFGWPTVFTDSRDKASTGADKGNGHYAGTVTMDEFFDTVIETPIDPGTEIELVCPGNSENSLLGDPDKKGYKNNDGEYVIVPSTAYLIKQILNITRIAVIAIVITLGTIDIAKAVLASKEEEMKKAQTTFIKRIIACIAVFLVPTFVTIIMKASHSMWEAQQYTACTWEETTIGDGQSFTGHGGKF